MDSSKGIRLGKQTATAQMSGEVIALAKSQFPYRQSVFRAIYEKDSASTHCKLITLLITAVLMLALPLVPSILVNVFGLRNWDSIHLNNEQPLSMTALLQAALGLSAAEVWWSVRCTFGVFGGLMLLDLVDIVKWPRSWHTEDERCYSSMFCEPSRAGRLIKHPGNSFSNAIYFFGSLCVMQSATRQGNLFWAADYCFGVMLLLLAGTSFVWHASNAPKSHYPDLWAMDSCICYLIIRFVAIGIQALLCKVFTQETANPAAAGFCLLLYAMLSLTHARSQFCHAREGLFDAGFQLSGRTRLLRNDMDIQTTCMFFGMPVLFMILPTIVQAFIVGSVGSIVLGTVAAASLVLGWGLRMFERFVLDGWTPMNLACEIQSRANCKATWITVQFRQSGGTVLAALVSPTAALHWFTGVTLLVGYMNVRSLDATLNLIA